MPNNIWVNLSINKNVPFHSVDIKTSVFKIKIQIA
jgi:hypothetical protein